MENSCLMAELDLCKNKFWGEGEGNRTGIRTREGKKAKLRQQMERDGYRPCGFIAIHWKLNCAPWPNEM